MNDVTKRAMSVNKNFDFRIAVTKDEDSLQRLLQLVEAHPRKDPSFKKGFFGGKCNLNGIKMVLSPCQTLILLINSGLFGFLDCSFAVRHIL